MSMVLWYRFPPRSNTDQYQSIDRYLRLIDSPFHLWCTPARSVNRNESAECSRGFNRCKFSGGNTMKKFTLLLLGVATLAGVVVFVATTSRHVTAQAAPIFVKKIPPGYRDWKLVSVAHEAGELNDIRALKKDGDLSRVVGLSSSRGATF